MIIDVKEYDYIILDGYSSQFLILGLTLVDA